MTLRDMTLGDMTLGDMTLGDMTYSGQMSTNKKCRIPSHSEK